MIILGRGRQRLVRLGETVLGQQRLGQAFAVAVVDRPGPVQDQADAGHRFQVVKPPGDLEVALQGPIGLAPIGARRGRAPQGDVVGPFDLEAPHRRVGQGRRPQSIEVELKAHGRLRLKMNSSSKVPPTGN